MKSRTPSMFARVMALLLLSAASPACRGARAPANPVIPGNAMYCTFGGPGIYDFEPVSRERWVVPVHGPRLAPNAADVESVTPDGAALE